MTTLYGLKNCDTCRKAQNWLKRFGIEYRFVDYRDERQSPDTLVAWKDALGGWGAMVKIGGAVIANGTVEVAGNRQVVQHPQGGVVTEILARDGDTVAAGQVLLRLEGDEQRAQFKTVEGQFFELVARQKAAIAA